MTNLKLNFNYFSSYPLSAFACTCSKVHQTYNTSSYHKYFRPSLWRYHGSFQLRVNNVTTKWETKRTKGNGDISRNCKVMVHHMRFSIKICHCNNAYHEYQAYRRHGSKCASAYNMSCVYISMYVSSYLPQIRYIPHISHKDKRYTYHNSNNPNACSSIQPNKTILVQYFWYIIACQYNVDSWSQE